jgi:hypothetical protein
MLGLLAGVIPLGGCVPSQAVPETAKTITFERVAEGFNSPVALAAPEDGSG